VPSDAVIRLIGKLRKRRADILESLKDVPDAIFVDLVIAKFDEQIAELEAGAIKKRSGSLEGPIPTGLLIIGRPSVLVPPFSTPDSGYEWWIGAISAG